MPRRGVVAAFALAVCAIPRGASLADEGSVAPIRSRQVELHYRLTATGQAEVDLWYTRDRGATWTRFGSDPDRRSPMIFVAPAEGMYGLMLIARQGTRLSRQPPQPGQAPQRWILVDETPPLAQWEGVEPAAVEGRGGVVQLRWTAYDTNLAARPVGLAYRTAGEETWRSIDDALPNTGRFDWEVEGGITEPVSFRLTVRDMGGHIVERIIGPVSVASGRPVAMPGDTAVEDSGAAVRLGEPVPATRPALMTETRLSLKPPEAVAAASRPADADAQREAERLYRQGSWHLLRGEYGLAAERFREVLEIDPNMVSTLNDLAGIHYLQKDYDRAIELYERALARDAKHREALRGAALAYVGRREYSPSREMLGRLLEQDAHDAEAWQDLGDVLFMTGERGDALGHWSRATTADPRADAVIRKAKRRLELYGPAGGGEAGPGDGQRR